MRDADIVDAKASMRLCLLALQAKTRAVAYELLALAWSKKESKQMVSSS